MPVDQYFDCPISALGIFPETVRPELLDFARTEHLTLLPQEPFQEQLGIGEFFRLPVRADHSSRLREVPCHDRDCRIMSKPQTTSQPLLREDLDLHVALRIRECIDAVLVLYQNDDDGIEATLKEGGETVLWAAVQKAIADAGWQVARRPK